MQKFALEKAFKTDSILKKVSSFVSQEISFVSGVNPEFVTFEKYAETANYIFMYKVEDQSYRVVIMYNKLTDNFMIIEKPQEILVKPAVVFETQIT